MILMKKMFSVLISKWKSFWMRIWRAVYWAPRAGYNFILFFLRKINIIHTYDYLKKFKNIHKGQRAFFVGTGPSLRLEDVEMLKGEIVFGVNSLVESVEKISFPLTYYGLADKRAVELFYGKAAKSSIGNIFVGSGRLSKRDIISDNTMRFPDTMEFYAFLDAFTKNTKLRISDDITKIVYDGGTVIYVMLQIAAYMGITEMYLIGVDCNYAPGVSNFNEFRPREEIKRGGNEMTQIGAYIKFKEYADTHGIKVYNATRGGMLDVFPRVNFDELIMNKRC